MFITATSIFFALCPLPDTEGNFIQKLICYGDGMSDPPYTSQPRSDYPLVTHGGTPGSTVEGPEVSPAANEPTVDPGTKPTDDPTDKPKKPKKPKKPNRGKSLGHFK